MSATQTSTHTVTRGSGQKVHQAVAYVNAEGVTYYAGTVCASDVAYAGRQDLRLRNIDHPVTCKTCLGDVAAPVADVAVEAPDRCPMHAGAPTVKTIKAGTKSEYACGAIFWHSKGWDPRRNHA